jgi:peroxiredoxin Q/BCP
MLRYKAAPGYSFQGSRNVTNFLTVAVVLTGRNSLGDEIMSKPSKGDLTVGQKAPDFTVLNDQGEKVKLSDLKGKKIVLYFYPKDDTPGCTKEACAFRDGIAQIKKKGAVVLGVSADSVESHQKFKKKFDLNFPLLADTDKKLVEGYGVWKEKSMYGKKYMGIERTTFVIDEEGKISHIFPKVKVDEHYEEVLKAL